MSCLRIWLFGNIRVARDGHPAGFKLPPATQALLAYLVIHRRARHSRDVLVGVFWGGQREDRARRALSTALWRLRDVLETDGVARGSYLIGQGSGEVAFNLNSDLWMDVDVFERQAALVLGRPLEALDEKSVAGLETALELYTGDLLEGIYEDWALRERERVRLLYLNSLQRLTDYYQERGLPERSLGHGLKVLELDPLRETVHRQVMRLYWVCGRRADALRQYEVCRTVLADELGIPPMAETQDLHAQLVDEARREGVSPPTVPSQPGIRRALVQLEEARQRFDAARERLSQAIRSVEHLAGGQGPGPPA